MYGAAVGVPDRIGPTIGAVWPPFIACSRFSRISAAFIDWVAKSAARTRVGGAGLQQMANPCGSATLAADPAAIQVLARSAPPSQRLAFLGAGSAFLVSSEARPGTGG